MERLPDEISQLEQRALLHAAGELSADEAAALDREALENGQARQALETARDLLAETTAGLLALSKSEAMPERLVRRARDQAAKAIFTWVDVEREAHVIGRGRRHPFSEGVVWRYARWPLAAAALLVVGMVIWTFTSEPAQNLADGRPLIDPVPEETDGTSGAIERPEVELDQIAALFDNPSRDGADLTGVEFAGSLGNELAALRLLEEADYE